MKIKLIISLYFAIALCASANAANMDEIIIAAEEQIAKQQHLEKVALNLNVERILVGQSDLELLEVNCLPSGRTARIKVMAADGEHNMVGSYDRAVLLPMALHHIEKGQMIEEGDIALLKWQARQQGKHHILTTEEAVGQQARHRITPYHPIRNTDLQQKTAVTKGKQVTIKFVRGDLSIKSYGEAQEAGSIGQRIRVRNIDSNKIISATVHDEDTVEAAR